ncbi:hypothetical protein D3OALGA1CA_4266 [Olavius algarvensis associated proteobacterium Delta 3]|nr:hypothetical protein D3OALGB2SA_76 [Olavius algarvensis associated proteobacterium Delta 3]CAB5148170.1 hypothetical protein D3OALGA1CA_4266 [Olavius algarvensis associated proteobacterium Delta 3]
MKGVQFMARDVQNCSHLFTLGKKIFYRPPAIKYGNHDEISNVVTL